MRDELKEKLKGLALGIGLAVVGGGILGWVAWGAWEHQASTSWSSTPAQVVETHVVVTKKKNSSTTKTSPHMTYSYVVDGKDYVSDTISFVRDHDYDVENQRAVERYVTALAEDPQLVAYYDPSNPERACLEPGGPWDIGVVGLGGGLGLVTFAAGILILWGTRSRKETAQVRGHAVPA